MSDIGAKTLERVLSTYYTDDEVRSRLPGTRQNQSQRMKVIREAAGVTIRGLTLYRRREVEKYFANPPRPGRPRNKKDTPAVESAPVVEKKTAVKKTVAKKKAVAKKKTRKTK